MNSRCSATLRRLLPGLALIWAMLGASCSTENQYGGASPGGGFYVSQVTGPTFKFAKNRFLDLRNKGSNFLSKLTHNDSGYWNGDDMPGKPSMRINLSEQKIYFYKGGELAGESPISSGREGYDTRPGKFSVLEKDKDHKSSVYGWYVGPDGEVLNNDVDIRKDPKPRGAKFDAAEMRYFMRISGGIGMHAGYLPGYAASHGCIRLPERMAEAFFNASSVGTPVTIVP